MHYLEQIDRTFYINDSKIRTLKWLEPLVFFGHTISYFEKETTFNDILLFLDIPTKFMQLKLFVNHTKDQTILIHLDFFLLKNKS